MAMYFEPFTFTLEQLTALLKNEFNILSMDTTTALDSLRKELQILESYFIDVDELERRATMSHVLTTHLQHLKEIAIDIQDLHEIFYQEAADINQRSMWKKLKLFVSGTNPLLRTHEIIERVEKLKQQLKEAIDSSKGYHLPSNSLQAKCRQRPPTYPYPTNHDKFIIGFDEDVKALVSKILGKEVDLTAIVGMGGSGKTTLARKIYNQKEIMERFRSRAWVCVSREWSTHHLLQEICMQVGVHLESGDETSVPIHRLHEFLMNHSYFIVLDDVWRIQALQELLPVISSAKNICGGRVLITTRNKNVVNFPGLGGLYIHKTRRLTLDESWELFCTIICKNWQGVCNFVEDCNFSQLGRRMLEKCKGLPLAIVALAGLLSTKGTIQEWESVSKDVMSRIIKYDNGSHDYGPMKEILELSYLDLPYYLKSCFLYLGIFQEDDPICVDQLIPLWIAEGFVNTTLYCNESEVVEELARDFLDELILRCMVQVDARDCGGKVQVVRIHGLMRDLCIIKAKCLGFFETSSSSILDPISSKLMSHRAIIHKGKSFSTYNPRLRSFICLENRGGVMTKLELPYSKMNVLRVLHLIRVDLGDSGEAIGNLTLLRYLRIERCSGIKKLIESTVALKNLLTFIYNGSDGQSLPNNMVGSMEQLRHLLLSYNGVNAGQTLGVDKSRNLQVLRAVAGEWISNELCVLTIGLQELHLTKVHSQAQLKAITHFVRNLDSHLHTLQISLREDSRLEFDMGKLKLERSWILKRLVLWGKIKRQHSPLLFPPNILSLQLRATRIEEEDNLKQALGQLHYLRHLVLDSDAYNASKLTMIGLPQLQELTLSNMPSLKEVTVKKGALPQLNMLHILHCSNLERIPKGINYLCNLQCLRASFVSKSLRRRLGRSYGKEDDGDEGKDLHLIQHIPFVEIWNLNTFPIKRTYSI